MIAKPGGWCFNGTPAMTETSNRYTVDRVVKIGVGALGVVALFLLLRYLADVLLPFAAAVVLAYLLNPLVTYLERKTRRRGLAVATTLVGLGVIGTALTLIIVPLMIGQVRQFGTAIEKLRNDLTASAEPAPNATSESAGPPGADEAREPPREKSAMGWEELKQGWADFRRRADELPRAVRLANLRKAVSGTYIGDLLERVIQYTQSEEFNHLLVSAAKRLAVGGWTVVTFGVNLLLGLTGLIVVLLYLVFLLLDYPAYVRTWKTFLPPAYRESIISFWEQFETAMRRYFRGKAVVALIVGILSAVGFTLVGLPMSVPFGLFVGLLNMVPYLQTVAVVPAIPLAGLRAIEGDSSFLVSVILTLAVFAVVQVIEDALLTPKILGKATGLRPVAILLGLFIWGKLLGVLGLLLAIPLTCLGIAYYQRLVLGQEAAVAEKSAADSS